MKLTEHSFLIKTDGLSRLEGLHEACSALKTGVANSAIVADVDTTAGSQTVFAIYAKRLVEAISNKDPIQGVFEVSSSAAIRSSTDFVIPEDKPSFATVIKAALSLEHRTVLPELRGIDEPKALPSDYDGKIFIKSPESHFQVRFCSSFFRRG